MFSNKREPNGVYLQQFVGTTGLPKGVPPTSVGRKELGNGVLIVAVCPYAHTSAVISREREVGQQHLLT